MEETCLFNYHFLTAHSIVIIHMNQAHKPFHCAYTPNVPELLARLNCSLAISTYQAGKVILLSPQANGSLIQLARTFQKPMGIALQGNKMVVACLDEVLVLVNSPELGKTIPGKEGIYDSIFMPRAAWFTGQIDIHDIDLGTSGEIFAVNTGFSCVIKIDDNFSFSPVWKPPFVSHISSDDRCHLNGLAMQNGKPKFVTAFGTGNSHQSWRETVTTGGVLLDVESNEIVVQNLPMPHSPRLFDGKLFMLLSATGEVALVHPENGKYDIVARLGGFVRGLARRGDFLFVGLSKVRKSSPTFSKLGFAEEDMKAGIAVVHLPTGTVVGGIHYEHSVEEIYDVQVLPGILRPNILNTLRPEHKQGLTTPETTFWAKPKEKV